MPSIAQQDYIVIAPKVAETIDVDAYALGQLAKILEKRDMSIFDVIVKNISINDGEDLPNFGRIISIGYDSNINTLNIHDAGNQDIRYLNLPYTSTQYEGLAAVQEVGEELEGETSSLKKQLPDLNIIDGYLTEDIVGFYITDPDGHKISVTATDGKLAAVSISEEIEEEQLKVPFKEIQKLIGFPITMDG